MKLISFLILLSLYSFSTFSQIDTLRVQTSAVCETCKKTLEHDLSFEKGIKKSVLDLDSKILTVVYNSEKTNPEKIRLAITEIGYNADSLVANPKAFNKLPECCKKPH